MIVPTSDLIERIMDFSMTQRLDYRLKGEAKLSNAAFGTLPFDQDGSFALPKLPCARAAAHLRSRRLGAGGGGAGVIGKEAGLSQPIESYGFIGNMVSASPGRT